MIGSWPSNRIREAAVAKDLAKCCTSPWKKKTSVDRSIGDRCPIETLLGVRTASEPTALFILPATALCAETDWRTMCQRWQLAHAQPEYEMKQDVRSRPDDRLLRQLEPTCLCPLDFYPCTEWIIDADVSRTMANSSARHICHHLRNLATRSSSSHGIRFPNLSTTFFRLEKVPGENLVDEEIN